jgi:hypothetical protein
MITIATELEGRDSGPKNLERKQQQFVHLATSPGAVWWLAPRISATGARGSRSTVERIVLSGVRRSNSEGMKYTERHSIL